MMSMMVVEPILSFQQELPHTSPDIIKSIVNDVLEIYPVVSLFLHNNW